MTKLPLHTVVSAQALGNRKLVSSVVTLVLYHKGTPVKQRVVHPQAPRRFRYKLLDPELLAKEENQISKYRLPRPTGYINIMSWSPPTDLINEYVTVIGDGTLGRRVGLMWTLKGGSVRVMDTKREAAEKALKWIQAQLPAQSKKRQWYTRSRPDRKRSKMHG